MDTEPAAELRRDEARRLYVQERLSERAVADRMGVSKSRVHQLLIEAGVRRRSVGRHPARRSRASRS